MGADCGAHRPPAQQGAAFGLIAGAGRFPLEIARAARAEGLRLCVAGLRELSDPVLAREFQDAEDCEFAWFYLGELEALFRHWRSHGVRDAVMVGKVPKTFLWQRPEAFRPDATTKALLAGLANKSDDSLQGAVAEALAQSGFRLLPQTALTPGLCARPGALGAVEPSPAHWQDIRFAWPIAKALGGLDVGQTVVVQDRAVLALEAVEGTDAAIARGCALAAESRGCCVVKVAKPGQSARFDLPTIGLATIRAMTPGCTLAVEAEATVVLQREALLRAADAEGIAVVGISAEELDA